MKRNKNNLFNRLGILLLSLCFIPALSAQQNLPNPTLWWKFIHPIPSLSEQDGTDINGAVDIGNRFPDYAFFIDPPNFGSATAAEPGKANWTTYPVYAAAEGVDKTTGTDPYHTFSEELVNGDMKQVMKVNDDATDAQVMSIKAWDKSKVKGFIGTGARTVCFWMKLNPTACDVNSLWAQIMVLGATSFTAAELGENLSLEMLPGSRSLKIRTGNLGFQSDAVSIEDNIWYFVALRNPENPKFYNMELVINANTVLSPDDSNTNFDIPVDVASTGGTFFFRQKVQGFSFADVRFYDQYLTDAQLAEIGNFTTVDNLVVENTGNEYKVTNVNNNEVLFTSTKSYADEIFSKALELVKEGGRITVRAGEYLTEQTIILHSDVTLCGEDTTSVIKKITPGHVIAGNGVENVTLKKLKILSSISLKSSGNGIFLRNASSFNTIDSCVVRNVSGHGIYIINPTSNYNVVSNNKISDCNGNTGIGFQNMASHATIAGNEVKRTKTHGILIGSGSNTVIMNNYIEESGFYRLEGAAISEYFCHGIAIGGNDLLATGTRGKIHLIQNNTIINSGRAGIEIADRHDSVIIRDNYVHTTGLKCGDASDQYGIYFGGAIGNGIHGKIINNEIYNTKTEGIKIASNNVSIGRTVDVLVDSNYISNASQDGIRILCAKDVIVTNNEILNSVWNGIKVAGPAGLPAQNITITGNEVSSSSHYGLDLSYCDNINATNNSLCDNTLGEYHAGSGLGSAIKVSDNGCISTSIEQNDVSQISMFKLGEGRYQIKGIENPGRMTIITFDILGRIVSRQFFESDESVIFSLPINNRMYILSVFDESGKAILNQKMFGI
jgi:parallel beta-helix repeat protein